MGMISPFLPLAVTAQVFMGTVYVYTSKFTTDLNLFYSLGDSAVFLSLQVYGKNADALGGCISSFLATWLYDEVSPFAPWKTQDNFWPGLEMFFFECLFGAKKDSNSSV